jgi:hypothetical protein
MKSCRLPVAAACLLTVLLAAGWVASAAQAAGLNQARPVNELIANVQSKWFGATK